MRPLASLPPLTKVVIVLTTVLSLLVAIIKYQFFLTRDSDETEDDQVIVPFLTLVPAASYLFPWVLLTTTFVQQNMLSVSVSDLNCVANG